MSPEQPSVTELMGQGEIITEAEIRAWSVRLPFPLNGDDLAKMAVALNLMRVTVHAKDAIAPQQEAAMRRVITHINGLSQELPPLIAAGRKFGSAGATSAFDAFDNLLSAVKLAKKWLNVRAANWSRKIDGQRHSAPWHDDAAYLAFMLERAAARSGKRVSFSKPTAPGVAFIDVALKRAHVKHGSYGAIARAMARFKSKMKSRGTRQADVQ